MIYRFGAFELDDARFELRHGGAAAEVQPTCSKRSQARRAAC
jgi:hypothetical protein